MQWQDWVFSIGGFVVLVSLIPTIRGDQKPALTTSAMTTVLMAVHKPALLRHCDVLACLYQGRLYAFGARERVLAAIQGQPARPRQKPTLQRQPTATVMARPRIITGGRGKSA